MKVTAYRKKSSKLGQIGAGTFYFLYIPDAYTERELNTFQFSFTQKELLEVSHDQVESFDGLPSEFLASTWFSEMASNDWKQKAHEFGFDESGAAMDIMVAEEARSRGWKAIKYGEIELQIL